jgi:hypothetical protein
VPAQLERLGECKLAEGDRSLRAASWCSLEMHGAVGLLNDLRQGLLGT